MWAFEAQRRDKTPRRLVVAAATAVIVMLVGLGTWALVGGDEDAASEAEIDVVLSAIDAFNRGDFDAYRGWLTGVALSDENNSPRESDEMTFANRTTELAGCRVAGTAPTGEKIVECLSTSTDDFYSTGGIVDTQTATFTVTEDGRISTQDSVGIEGDIPWEETEFGMFNFAFWSWLMDAHPGVFDEIGPAPHNMSNIPGLDDSFGGDRHEPEEMLVALQYVDEFVAQSDVYPLSR